MDIINEVIIFGRKRTRTFYYSVYIDRSEVKEEFFKVRPRIRLYTSALNSLTEEEINEYYDMTGLIPFNHAFESIEQGYLDLLKILIKRLNESYGPSFVGHAIKFGNFETFKYLLDRYEIRLNTDHLNLLALKKSNNMRIIEYIFNNIIPDYESALLIARKGYLHLFKRLNIDIDENILNNAISSGNMELVNYILARYRGVFTKYSVEAAIKSDNIEMFEFITELAGVPIDGRWLDSAIEFQNKELISKLIVEYRVNPDMEQLRRIVCLGHKLFMEIVDYVELDPSLIRRVIECGSSRTLSYLIKRFKYKPSVDDILAVSSNTNPSVFRYLYHKYKIDRLVKDIFENAIFIQNKELILSLLKDYGINYATDEELRRLDIKYWRGRWIQI